MHECLLINLFHPKTQSHQDPGRNHRKCIWTMFMFYLCWWCVSEQVWVSLAAHGLTLIHRMLPCVLLLILRTMRNVCISIHGPNSWKLSVASAESEGGSTSALSTQKDRTWSQMYSGSCQCPHRLEVLAGMGHWQLGPDIWTCFSVSFRDCIRTV